VLIDVAPVPNRIQQLNDHRNFAWRVEASIAKKKKPGKFEKVPAGQPVQTKPVANQHNESQEI
jgi:hypothetical protein